MGIVTTNDAQIRKAFTEALARYLEKYRENTGRPTKIIQELGICNGKKRVDIATINGTLHGYEIKSDLDTLYRLPDQIIEYNKVFDKMTLIVGEKHVIDALNMVPEWWGIKIAKINADGVIIFNTIRIDSRNPTQENYAIARLLWKQEALALLSALGNINTHTHNTCKTTYDYLAGAFSREDLLDVVKSTLLARQGWRVG